MFHSEADLQHALAWRLPVLHPSVKVRLERPLSGGARRVHLDIWVAMDGQLLAIELKYKTRRLSAVVDGERFELRDQRAQDIVVYDFLADLMRVERLLKSGSIDKGLALILTNDRNYWGEAKKPHSVESDFRLHEGRILTGTLSWGDVAASGPIEGREESIEIVGAYLVKWGPYSKIGRAIFRYVLIEVGDGGSD